VTLLLTKRPSIDSPFYSTPFDGVIGEQGGRQGYGTVYKTTNTDKKFTITNQGDDVVTAKESGASNGSNYPNNKHANRLCSDECNTRN